MHHDHNWIRALQLVTKLVSVLVALVCVALIYLAFGESLRLDQPDKGEIPSWVGKSALTPQVVDGVDIASGLIVAAGFAEVRSNCTNCHSAKLITQNRMSRDAWRHTIVWMQTTQGLWDLGDKQTIILDYLSTHYAPEDAGRRANLQIAVDEWYRLDLD